MSRLVRTGTGMIFIVRLLYPLSRGLDVISMGRPVPFPVNFYWYEFEGYAGAYVMGAFSARFGDRLGVSGA